MGCVQAKPSSSSESPSRGIKNMKLQHGYAAVKDDSTHQRECGSGGKRAVVPASEQMVDVQEKAGSGNCGVAAEEKAGSFEGGGGGGGVAVSRPREARRRPAAAVDLDETIDGWPKWLINNVPPEVLFGLVPKSADSYDKIAKIGQGTYSNVYKARDRETGKIVALKKVRFETSESESVKFMAREIMILQKLDHPNIVKLEGLATSRMHYSLYLVFDFMTTDLARVVNGSDIRLTEPQVKCYMQQLLAGLQHCHERGILHRDIKGSNLLIDRHGMLKIADFGLANSFSHNQRRPLTSRVVTLWYRAPELLFGATDYGIGIDLWSAGCLLAEMFAGRPIMPGRTEIEQIHRIYKLCGSPPDDYWKRLRLNTNYRPAQPYKQSYLETFRDFPASSLGLLTTLLDLEPTRRGNAATALHNEFFTTFPLACSLSELPITYQEEDEPQMQPISKKKNNSSKIKRLSKSKPELFDKQEEEKNMKNTDTQVTTKTSILSSTISVSSNRFPPITDSHLWEIKNVENWPNNISGKGEDKLMFRVDRSTSKSDFRRLEGHKLVNRYYALQD